MSLCGNNVRKVPIKRFISRRFFKAALLPLLVIELALLILYFSINVYNDRQTRGTLETISKSHLQNIAVDQSDKISEQLYAVTSLTSVLQKETERFFTAQSLFPLPEENTPFAFASNGVYYKVNNNGGASLFYSTLTSIGPEERKKAEQTEALDPIYRHVYKSNKNIVAVYLNTFDSMCRYYPFIDDCFDQFSTDMNVQAFNFYYLADAAHNPDRKPVWTEAYLDPAGKGWMMSCIAPIYNGDFLEGVVGIDVTIDRFINNLLALKLPWEGKAFLVDFQGTIMAMPPEVEQAFELKELHEYVYSGHVQQDTFKPEEFNLSASKIPLIAKTASELLKKQKGVEEIQAHSIPYYLAQATVAEPNWKLFILANKNTILAPAKHLERNFKNIGLTAVIAMALFYVLFFVYLFRNAKKMSSQLAEPVVAIVEASKSLAHGDYRSKLDDCGIEELDILSSSFSTMAHDLQHSYNELETRVQERTAELKTAQEKIAETAHKAGMAEVATDVLHNVGNVLNSINISTAFIQDKVLNSKIINLTKVIDLISDHHDDLGAFLTNDERGQHIPVYLAEAVKLIAREHEDIAEKLHSLSKNVDHIKHVIKAQQGYAGTTGVEVLININEVIEDAVEINSAGLSRHDIQPNLDLTELPKVYLDKQRILQILVNLIKNAKQALSESDQQNKQLIIRCYPHGEDKLRIDVEDNGIGIPLENSTRIFRHGFTTKKGGHGFGLHSGALNAREMGGALTVHSDGPGHGATFILELPLKTEQQKLQSRE